MAPLRKSWAFLCACVSPYSHAAPGDATICRELNWQAILELSDQHGVQGLLAKKLEESDFAGVPPGVRKKLQARMRAQHIFTLGMTAELFRILQDFANAHIDVVLVKGPVISLLAYGDPAVRSYSDLDLVLRHRDIPRAAERMLALGFQSHIPETAIRSGKIPGEYVFARPDVRRIVELHTEPTFRYYPKPMQIENLFAQARTVLLDGREVPALKVEDELLLNCIHAAKHLWERLMWVADIAGLVARCSEIDWEQARRAAAAARAERMLRIALQLAGSLLGSKIPEVLAAEIQRDHATQKICRRILGWLPDAGAVPPSLAARAIFRLQMAGGGAAGATYLLRLSLLPTHEDWAKTPEDQRAWLRESLRRPLRLFRKYGTHQ